jgi:hypothetical protein
VLDGGVEGRRRAQAERPVPAADAQVRVGNERPVGVRIATVVFSKDVKAMVGNE